MTPRLEFLFNLDGEDKVFAFLDFSSLGVSFGLPKVFNFDDYNIQPPSENYERITVHANGLVKTHFPLAQNYTPLWDGQHTPLATWQKWWSMREELYWGAGLTGLVKRYLARPKFPSSLVHQIPLVFAEAVDRAVVRFTLIDDLNGTKLDEVPCEVYHPSFRTWALTDSWPYILVSISGLDGSHDPVELKSIGKDYRRQTGS